MRDVVSRILLSVTAATVLSAASHCARADDGPSPDRDGEVRIASLVKQLGHDDCKVRETASAQLAQLGMATKPALTEALEHTDLEVRIRARQLLTVVLAEEFQRQLREFAEDVNDLRGLDLPYWKKFKKAFGGDATARKLFVAMQREEADLLNAADRSPQRAAEALNQCYLAAQAGMPKRYAANRNGISLETVAAMVLVGSDPNVQLPDTLAYWIANLPRQPAFMQAMSEGADDSIPRRLFVRWLQHPAAEKNLNLASQNMNLANRLNMTQTLTPALQILGAPTANSNFQQYAILAIGKYGTKEQLAPLEPFLQHEDKCGVLVANGKPGGPTDIQLRDVTLAVMVHLSGQDPKDYGYDYLVANDQFLYAAQTIGFADSEKREAALKKWHEWSAAQKK